MPGNERDEWDEILERGVATYVDAEPHPSLERRVLARTAAVQAKPQYIRWRWATAAMLAALLACTLLWRDHAAGPEPAPSASIDLGEKPLALQTPKQSPHTSPGLPAVTDVAVKPRQETRARIQRTLKAESLPKLDVFPSPSPASEEERALIAFIQQHPEAGKQLIEAERRSLEPIQIAEIHIAPLNVSDLQQQRKKDEDEREIINNAFRSIHDDWPHK